MTDELETRRTETLAERSYAGTTLSTQGKTVALGVLAVVWLLLGGTQQALSTKFACFTTPLLWIAFVAVLALLLDFTQYVFSFIESNQAVKAAMNATTAEDAGWESESVLRTISSGCFVAKLIATVVAALWLLSIMFAGLV